MPNPLLGFSNLTAYDGMVVLVSILLVFAMLVALSLIVTAEGKLFDLLTARKKAKARAALASPLAEAPAPAAAAAAAPAPAAPAAPSVNGIAPEIVAAIAAAVTVVEGEGAAIRGIRRLPAGAPRRRGAWGDAGVAESVQPF